MKRVWMRFVHIFFTYINKICCFQSRKSSTCYFFSSKLTHFVIFSDGNFSFLPIFKAFHRACLHVKSVDLCVWFSKSIFLTPLSKSFDSRTSSIQLSYRKGTCHLIAAIDHQFSLFTEEKWINFQICNHLEWMLGFNVRGNSNKFDNFPLCFQSNCAHSNCLNKC